MQKRAANLQSGTAGGPETRFGPTDSALLVMTVIWGMNMVVVKLTYLQIIPMAFMSLRFVIATLLLLLLLGLFERSLSVQRRDWLPMVVAGMVGTGLYQPLFVNGLAMTTASTTALIIATSPAFVALINRFLGREILSARGWLGILLAFFGILLIIQSGEGINLQSGSFVGDVMILLATFLWACYAVLSAPLMVRYSPLRVTALTTSIGTLPLILFGIPAISTMAWQQVDSRGWSGLIYSAVFAIVVGYVIWNFGVKKIGGARTALYSNLIPVVGAIGAAIFLGETMTPFKVAGAAVILAGLHLARTARVVTR